jgi:hypothetical protein
MLLFLPFNTWAVNNQKKHVRNEGRHSKTILTIFDMLEIIFLPKFNLVGGKKEIEQGWRTLKTSMECSLSSTVSLWLLFSHRNREDFSLSEASSN